jgi:hypothetical protein
MSTTVKVAAYRDATDHLFRLANVDYHACVNVREVASWQDTTTRVLAETEGLECGRANAYDRRQFADAIAAVKARLVEAQTRIAQLQVPREVVDPQSGKDPQSHHTAAEFRQWSLAHKSLAQAVCKAKAFAELERVRVDAYVLPIFNSFGFVDEAGEKIQNPIDLYLCEDATMCTAFYAQCELAHRAHGFTGPEGHCPALTAEALVITAENALLQAGCEFLGLKEMPSALYGNKRKEMLDLLLKACVGAQ